MADGKWCICAAFSKADCACDADWTPQELIDARAEIARLRPTDAEVNAIRLGELAYPGLRITDNGKWVDVWATIRGLLERHGTGDTPPPHATPPQGSVQGEGSFRDSRNAGEPLAWAVMVGGERMYVSWSKEMCEDEAYYHRHPCGDSVSVVPLDRLPLYEEQPTLTDVERQAVERAATWMVQLAKNRGEIHSAGYLVDDAAALRGLLDRSYSQSTQK